MAEITFGEAYGGAYGGADRAARRPVPLIHLAGGVVSLALIVGIGVWGTKIILRDVTGIPVVRAMADGPMRVAPEHPGGAIAAHAGLTVNTIAAEGEAGALEDQVVLAPHSVDLAAEDFVAPAAAEADAAPEDAVLTEAAAPLSADQVLELADRIAAGVEPIAAADAVLAAVQEAVDDEAAAIEVIPAAVPGVSRSLRPWTRPASLVIPARAEAPAAAPATAPGGTTSIPVLADDLPEGTKLVQLGAYDSTAMAEADWARIAARFGDYLGGTSPLIQVAESGGGTFYRLRAQGFDDLAEARRLCSVLMAENAPCIPVVVR